MKSGQGVDVPGAACVILWTSTAEPSDLRRQRRGKKGRMGLTSPLVFKKLLMY
jgi:hypothetical protein